MALPHTQAIQNNNKCPHGFPLGACPICSGMGGGSVSKDKNKPRKPGEMSYNECMAVWNKMQAQKEAKIKENLNKIQIARENALRSKILSGLDKVQKTLDKFILNFENAPVILKLPVKIIISIILKPLLNIISKIPQAINNIQAFLSNIGNFISSVSEKMAMILGEIKNFADYKISQIFKKPLKTLLSLFSQAQQDNKEDEEVEKLKAREFKKILKSLFRIKSREEKEKENDYNLV